MLTGDSRRYLETGSRNQADDRNAFRVLAGVKGDLGSNWSYDLYYQYSRTRNSSVQSGNIQLSALLAGLKTAYISPDGNTVSATPVAGYTLGCADASARANGCVPINVFGPNQISSDAANYISISATNLTEASTKVYSGVITNSDLFDLGAGPVGIALGVERREEFAKYQPDTFLASGDVGGFNAGLPTEGGYELTEFFGELNLPVLSGLSWAESIELNGALRYSDYSNSVGGVWTWAVGGIWDVAGGFSLRGNYQQAIRGPSVEELFGGRTVDFAGASDPCQTPEAASGALRDRCIANGVPAAVVGTDYGSGGTSFPAFVGGSSNLKEESAKTWTIGAVYVPEFIDRLSLTVDYYNITIDDYIGSYGSQNIVNACLKSGIESFCDLITRSSTGELESFVDLNVNAASLHTEGLDLGARYSLPLGDGFLGGGSAGLSFDFKGSYLFSLDYDAVAGAGFPVNECAGRFGRVCSDTVASGPTPHWRHSLRTTYRDGDAFLSVLWRHIGASHDEDDSTTYAVEHLDSVDYFDLTAGYDINEHFSLAAGVKNVFNKGFQPLASSQQGGNGQQSNTYPATYDVLGRYFSLSATVRF
ncbi:TonB-dependent receptor [Aurantiacibacter xanthus]|uniref:TonB-dependent receptor n=1 Tax=Aurantiacibacter xanthus TaxID=1784712 RepID=A0A3A1P552_9SPHN|nr:TonB-dependent receptor [Aurantiacibacter xanthus]RIV87230.1 TonB-dependent receptor [Aurantiacibacter xanthus]